MILVIKEAEQENRWNATGEGGLMQGKLIIPFHFHLDLMCQPHTPNLTTNSFEHFTGGSSEQKIQQASQLQQ